MLNESKFYHNTLSSSGVTTKSFRVALHTPAHSKDKSTKGLHFMICFVKFHNNDHVSHKISLVFFFAMLLTSKSFLHMFALY